MGAISGVPANLFVHLGLSLDASGHHASPPRRERSAFERLDGDECTRMSKQWRSINPSEHRATTVTVSPSESPLGASVAADSRTAGDGWRRHGAFSACRR